VEGDYSEKALEEELSELSGRIERLRVQYQQYFMGIERSPPSVQREQLERKIRHSPLNEVRRSSIKFRFQSTIQRLRTYIIYWDRVLREIEDGRFRRGVFRDGGMLSREADKTQAALAEKPLRKSGQKKALKKAAEKTAKKAGGKKAPVKKKDKAAKEKGPKKHGKPAKKKDDLYDRYIEARKSLDLPVEGITRESFDESLENQRRIQAEKLGAADVGFTVKVKAGKVILEARRKD